MISIQTDVIRPQINKDVITRNAARAADEIGLSVKNYVKIALTRSSKIATGGTLKSIEVERILDSASRGEFRRNVVGSKSFFFIQQGRRAGGKLPVVRVAGATKRGGALFMPAPELLKWFITLNIPRIRWFPILKAIARRGIKPVDVRGNALNLAKGRINEIANDAARRIANELFQTGK